MRVQRPQQSLRTAFSTKIDAFTANDQFLARHMGSQGADRQAMLDVVGFPTMEALIDSTLPTGIRLPKSLSLDAPLSESEALAKLKGIMSKNKLHKSFIGMGYYETNTPGVILRNVSTSSKPCLMMSV